MTTKLRGQSEAWIKQFTGSKPEIAELLDIHVDALALLDEMALVIKAYKAADKLGDSVLAKYEGKS